MVSLSQQKLWELDIWDDIYIDTHCTWWYIDTHWCIVFLFEMTGRTKGNNVLTSLTLTMVTFCSGLRFRILEAQMETGTPYMLYKAIICPTCLFWWTEVVRGDMKVLFVVELVELQDQCRFSSRIMPIANPTSRTWAPSIAPTYVVRSLSTLLQMKSQCAI